MGTSISNPLKFSLVQYWDGSASSTDSSKWVWKKPTLNFINEGSSGINSGNYNSSGFWTSYDLGGV